MRTATVVWKTAIVIFGTGAWACAARAEDVVKPGRWEFSATVPGSHLPPEVQPSPGMQMREGPDGVTFTRTECITTADPLPPMARGTTAPRDPDHPCKIDKTEVDGGTVKWSTTCATPQITVHQEGIVRYRGETLDGELTLRSTRPEHPPIERTQPLKGRYLGPCDDR